MESSTALKLYSSDIIQSTKENYFKPRRSLDKSDLYLKIFDVRQKLIDRQQMQSSITISNAGFHYTDNKNIIRCDICGLEVSDWLSDMKLFTIHAQRSPTCSFIRSRLPTERATVASSISCIQSDSILNDREKSCKRQKIEIPQENSQPCIFAEIDVLKQIRKRTFSHWPKQASPSSEQMIEAGFFNCNVGDRVICLYCNIICQQWTPNIDDPCEIHKILSPKCPYVIAMLKSSQTSAIPIINEDVSGHNSATSLNDNSIRREQIAPTTPCNSFYKEIPKRYASFNTWPNENLPSIDDLVRAGFFYTGTKTIVTCFYCHGSLQSWGANDNPMIEHARWFPHCAYAKQLCGAELYRKIQESSQRQKERDKRNGLSNQNDTSINNSCNRPLNIQDKSTLARYVAARLDLPITQRLLEQNLKLSVVKRCWEDQLRLKGDDFVSDSDLIIACTILQKQIKYIDGKKENILIPTVAINKIREKEKTEISSQQQTSPEQFLVNLSNDNDAEMSTSSESMTCKTTSKKSLTNTNTKTDMKLISTDNPAQKLEKDPSLSNPCALCLTEEKCLACIPCGHVATCVPCGHSLRSCPICRSEIKNFVRVYL